MLFVSKLGLEEEEGPLARLLLSMYTAQQKTNPVMKDGECGGRAALPVHGCTE